MVDRIILRVLVLHFLPGAGRKVSTLYAQAMLHNVWIVLPLILFLDAIQIPFYFYLYNIGTTSIRPLARFKARLIAKTEKGVAKKLLGWARRYGVIGVFLVAALPFFGGGVWTAVLLAYTLGLKKAVSYSALLLGCLAGITLLALGVYVAGSFIGDNIPNRFGGG